MSPLGRSTWLTPDKPYYSSTFTSSPDPVSQKSSLPSPEPTLSTPVQLSLWRHRKAALLVGAFAVVLQLAILATGCYLAFKPVEKPSGPFLSKGISIKNYNIVISFLATGVGLLSASCVALGAQSQLMRLFVSSGVTLPQFNFYQSLGSGGRASGFSLRAFASLLVLGILTNSNPAYVATFSAAPDRVTSYEVNLLYPTVVANIASLKEGDETSVPLYDVEDFEGFLFKLDEQQKVAVEQERVTGMLHHRELLEGTISSVDGTLSAVGSGVVPALYQVSTLTSKIFDTVGPGQRMSPAARSIIAASTNNTFVVTAPVVASSFACSASTVSIGIPQLNGETYLLNITSPRCANTSSLYSFQNTGYVQIAVVSCAVNEVGYIDYVAVHPPSGTIRALASCSGTVRVGDQADITYADSHLLRSTAAYLLPPGLNLTDVSSIAEPSLRVLTNWWGAFLHGSTSSFGLNSLVYNTLLLQGVNLDPAATIPPHNFTLSPEDFYATFEVITKGLTALAVAKLVNAATLFANYYPGSLEIQFGSQAYSSTVLSPAIRIGPDGYNRLWLLVILGVLLINCTALVTMLRFPPVTLNPLDPVSVLLLATNSPMTEEADGGCLGDVEAVRASSAIITLLAVNRHHLALV